MTVIGHHFHSLDQPTCSFGGIITSVSLESDEVIKCDVPISSWKGQINFSLRASNSLDPIMNDFCTYIEPWIVTMISPR
jgi:hypothetical protein